MPEWLPIEAKGPSESRLAPASPELPKAPPVVKRLWENNSAFELGTVSIGISFNMEKDEKKKILPVGVQVP